MELIHQCNKSGNQVMLIRGFGSERDDAEAELLRAGVPLALSDRAIWAALHPGLPSKFLLARDASGQACGGVAIEEVKSRALPGHLIFKVKRFGSGLPTPVCRVLLQALAALARKVPRILRLQVNVFSRDSRADIEAILKELGFAEVRPPSSYRHTLVIDLNPTEDEIFASLDAGCRNKIRKTIKKSLQSLVIDDPAYADRLRELQQEALDRTDGQVHAVDWQDILKMSKQHPHLSRVFGLFLGEDTAPEKMAAFTWVLMNGDHGEYRAAGSSRPAWETIRYAKTMGAVWFDMGGVTLEGADENALEGISRFKRAFSRNVVEIGSEWAMEPAPAKARIATVVSLGASRLRNLIGKRR